MCVVNHANSAITDARLRRRRSRPRLAEWRGEPLVDLADSAAALGERARLRELRLHATEGRFDVALTLGRHRELVGALEAHVAEEGAVEVEIVAARPAVCVRWSSDGQGGFI